MINLLEHTPFSFRFTTQLYFVIPRSSYAQNEIMIVVYILISEFLEKSLDLLTNEQNPVCYLFFLT